MPSRPHALLLLAAGATVALIGVQVLSLTATLERLREAEDARVMAALVRVRERVDPGDELTRAPERVLTPDGFDEAHLASVRGELRAKLDEELARQGLAAMPTLLLWRAGATDPRVPAAGDEATHAVHLGRSLGGEGIHLGVVFERDGWTRLAELPVLGPVSLLLALTIFVVCGAAMRLLRRVERRAQRQRELVENFAHELRTPVFALSVAVRALEEDAGVDAVPLLARVRSAAGRVRAHVDRLTALMSLERGGRPRSAVDLAALAQDVAPAYGARAEEAGGRLSVELGGGRGVVPGDGEAWTSVLENLLDNALRYSGEAPDVSLVVRAAGDDVELGVEDRGPGVPAGHREAIFERFHRVNGGTIHDTKGLGLGLAIAREAVRAAGGTLRYEARRGGGARFVARVPAAAESGVRGDG